jgi:pimeloyl-ACP methyl ester carboxylesterase
MSLTLTQLLTRRRVAWIAGGIGLVGLAASWRLGGGAGLSVAGPGTRVLSVRVVEEDGDSRLLELTTSRGRLEARHYPSSGRRAGVVWLGGATNEWRTPARGLYPRLASELRAEGVASLWLRHRDPANFDESVLAAAAAIAYLTELGSEKAAIVGYSFGGAVAIAAALAGPAVRAVVALATQAAGTGGVGRLGPRCALLLVHGEADRVLPPINAAEVFRAAAQPKELLLVQAGHTLDEAADQVAAATRAHILRHIQ